MTLVHAQWKSERLLAVVSLSFGVGETTARRVAGIQICHRFKGAQPDHARVESTSCCCPRELVSFDARHVTCSPPIGKRI